MAIKCFFILVFLYVALILLQTRPHIVFFFALCYVVYKMLRKRSEKSKVDPILEKLDLIATRLQSTHQPPIANPRPKGRPRNLPLASSTKGKTNRGPQIHPSKRSSQGDLYSFLNSLHNNTRKWASDTKNPKEQET